LKILGVWQNIPMYPVEQKQPKNAPLFWVTQVPPFIHGFIAHPFAPIAGAVVVADTNVSHKTPEYPKFFG
jgi:hypothetical protein